MQEDKKIKIIIFGKNGQVASNLLRLCLEEKNFEVKAFSSLDIDFSRLEALSDFLNNLKEIPNFIVNAAAYTAVDKAEEERELADKINHKAVEIIAKYCAKNDIKLIHYSTDYVFDGSGEEPFCEDNTKNLKPLNHYGKTKLDGENAIINSKCKYIILRTSWVYDLNGKNFVNTISKLAQEREELRVIDDQVGSPTKASYIAEVTIKIIKKSSNFILGIYHCTSSKYMSWHDFACQIVDDLRLRNVKLKVQKIIPIKTSEYKTAAVRPLNSRLNCDKLRNFLVL
jgi:dTDP-4-dehydrorhamnose reductase